MYVCIISCRYFFSLFTPTQGIIFFGIIKIFVSGLEKVLHGQRPYGSGGYGCCCCCMLSIILILRVVLLLLLRRIAGIEMLTTHSVWDHHDGIHVFLYCLVSSSSSRWIGRGLCIHEHQTKRKEGRKEGMVRKGEYNDIKMRGTNLTRRNVDDDQSSRRTSIYSSQQFPKKMDYDVMIIGRAMRGNFKTSMYTHTFTIFAVIDPVTNSKL